LRCRCTGISAAEVAAEAPPPDEAQFVAIWEALCDGRLPAPMEGGSADGDGGASALTVAARHEKHVKGKLSVAADHFNRDYKKGFQYLQVRLGSRLANCFAMLRHAWQATSFGIRCSTVQSVGKAAPAVPIVMAPCWHRQPHAASRHKHWRPTRTVEAVHEQ